MAHTSGGPVGRFPGYSTPGSPVLRLIDLQRAAAEVRAIQRLHGARCISVRHFDESETTWLTRGAVHHDGN